MPAGMPQAMAYIFGRQVLYILYLHMVLFRYMLVLGWMEVDCIVGMSF